MGMSVKDARRVLPAFLRLGSEYEESGDFNLVHRGLVELRRLTGYTEREHDGGHSAECWRWHHDCAMTRVSELRAQLNDMHRRAQQAEAALPAWEKYVAMARDQRTGRAFPALLATGISMAGREVATLQERVKELEGRHQRLALEWAQSRGMMRCESCQKRLRDDDEVEYGDPRCNYVATVDGYFCSKCWDEAMQDFGDGDDDEGD